MRPAERGDCDAITALFLAARKDAMPWLPVLHTDDETRWWIEHVVWAECRVQVAALAGTVAGFSAVRGSHLDHLYVAPNLQGRGIGRRLLRAAQDENPLLMLAVFQRNERARRIYEAAGFRLGELRDGADNEEGEPDAIYVWHAFCPDRGQNLPQSRA